MNENIKSLEREVELLKEIVALKEKLVMLERSFSYPVYPTFPIYPQVGYGPNTASPYCGMATDTSNRASAC